MFFFQILSWLFWREETDHFIFVFVFFFQVCYSDFSKTCLFSYNTCSVFVSPKQLLLIFLKCMMMQELTLWIPGDLFVSKFVLDK